MNIGKPMSPQEFLIHDKVNLRANNKKELLVLHERQCFWQV
uniref:Uncharacterized protein n=1 Tax=Rhizophora mucronata TaxID=61149 RepID=A0A2P2NHM3_RHIMU